MSKLLRLLISGLVVGFASIHATAQDAAPAPAAAPASASGREMPSDFYYHPNAGNYSLRVITSFVPKYSYSLNLGSTKLADRETTGTKVAVTGAYSFNANWTGSVIAGYASEETTQTSSLLTPGTVKKSGLTDILFKASNSTPMGKFHLHYGSDLTFSPSKAKAINFDTKTEGNQYTGGFSLGPYAGVSSHVGGHYFGGYANYRLKFERTESDGAATAFDKKITGGNTLTLLGFYEFHHHIFVADTYLGMQSVASEDTTKSSTVTDSAESYNQTLFGLGAGSMVAPTIHLKFMYDLAMVPERSISSTIKVSKVTVSSFSLRYFQEF